MVHGATRQQIVEAADDLFYRQGFEHTSFADIAKVVSISRGNFYHHFKTKDDILDAVIKIRLDRTQHMLADWEEEGATPKDRIRSYINILLSNWSMIKDYGCPVGTLCTELAKLNHASKAQANNVFTLFRVWLKNQFMQLGYTQDADALAMHVLSWSQGVATLGNAFDDYKYVKQEVDKMCDWLDSLSVMNDKTE
ncbi:MAG: TetR/AcrR family transcriptional regulator [Candidatus Thiodiazotropha taylori]|nr:TetR/AcrR family transcriptional regulator [Candidatus Thiodiazotropha taylori]MCG8051480.1 TetR/AcrR family transcriptional regulator [Candidatus Thiodiazotropha taylori]MCW4313299.1 TetR/AcrR family transcriptional regulator [Candidatus Thiodiazotropha taylori]MCW4320336.1 TetR/AcrR family transcriptional regulator [Candidatus Thiodiazotropha taylori]